MSDRATGGTPRRTFIAAALAAPAVLAWRSAVAKMPMGLAQAPYFYRFRLGEAECTVVTDGQLPLGDPNAAFVNITADEISRELVANFLPTKNAVLEQNVLVVNFGDRVVLFDTGMGGDTLFGRTTGQLLPSLKAAGIDPAAVDAVVMSHAHIDHCGGLVGAGGAPNFPNAQLFIGEPDFAYWTDDAQVPANYPARANFLKQARSNLLPLKDRITFYKHEQEILPGVTALSAPGHTVSHSIFAITSGSSGLAYIGDLAHHPVLLLENPRTQFVYDTDPVQSAESRVRYLDMLAANRMAILAYHFAWPGLGHVSKAGGGFRYHPEPVNLEGVNAL